MMKNHKVQTLIVRKIINDLGEQAGSHISVEEVRFSFFHDLVLNGLYIEDQKKDTLVYVDQLKVNFDSLNVFERKVYVSKLSCDKSRIRIIQNNDKAYNFTFLIDSLVPKDTVGRKKWDFNLRNIKLKQSDLSFYGKQDYHIVDADLDLELLSSRKDSLKFALNYLSFVDTVGIVLKDMALNLLMTPSEFSLTDMHLTTLHSTASIPKVYAQRDSLWKYLYTPQTNVEVEVDESRLSAKEIQRFLPGFANISEKIFFSGSVKGTIGDLRGSNLLFSTGDAFDLLFNLNVSGLPDLKNAFIFTDFKRMYLSPQQVIPEVENIFNMTIPLKNEIEKFGRILYTGTLTGFPGDFVAYGEMDSELGSINTDIALKDNKMLQKVEVSGNVSTKGFNLGELLGKPTEIGYVSLNVELEADKPYDDYLSVFMNGEVPSLEFLNYTYSNIYLRGVFGNRHFNGGVDINDPNLSMLFTGRIDFSDLLPLFDFEAEIRKLSPYNLNLSKTFKTGSIKTKIKTKLQGSHLDELEGFLGLYDLDYSNKNGTIKSDNATVFFYRDVDESSIQIKSDWINGKIAGQYKFNALSTSVLSIFDNYLPTLSNYLKTDTEKGQNNFKYNIKITDIDNIASVFELPYSISADGVISGQVNEAKDDFELHVNLEKTRFKNFVFDGLLLDIENEFDGVDVSLYLDQIHLKKRFLEQVSYKAVMVGDSIDNRLSWENRSDEVYKSDIKTTIAFNNDDPNILKSKFDIQPSYMIIGDTLWNIAESGIELDSTGVLFDNLMVSTNNHYLGLDGKMSKSLRDTLSFQVEQLDLSYLSRFMNMKKLFLDGTITGKSTILAARGTPVMESEFWVDSFMFNKVLAGDLDLNSHWDEVNRKMDIRGNSRNINDQALVIEGAYFPANDSLALNNKLDRLPIQYIQSYLDVIMQNLQGKASGDLFVGGNVKRLKLIGDLALDSGSFDVGYLNTKYYLSDTINLIEDAIVFNDIKVYDEFGHSGMFGGILKHKTFKDMEFDMFLDFNNMLALDTKARDNDLYYGKVFATGVMAISGKGSKVHMDINARTDKDTKVFLPLTSGLVAADNNFVHFVSVKESLAPIVETKEESGFSFNMEVEATPDARVELIFDSRIGDVIKGQGSGTLVFSYDAKADFKMYGDYTVSSGEYLFTAQNVINKKFDIEQGGVIKWSGDPYNAIIDLDAYYRTKAPLYELLPNTVAESNIKLRVPVNCHMMLTENLMSPAINFDIVLPTADQETQQSVANVLNSEAELQRQVIYLLMFNRFHTPEYLRGTVVTEETTNQSQAAYATASEFFSNQFSYLLSQISEDFDFGFNYRPAGDYTDQEVEVMFGTQMFNDRLSINGNFGYRDYQTGGTSGSGASNFVGDFDVAYILNQKGNFNLKAYSHSNDNIIYENSPTTQGVGFVYKEEFDSFGDLVQRYKRLLGDKNKDLETETKDMAE